MKATAFCPGHITGFFQICEHNNILATGSRGAGLCISMGAISDVSVFPGTGNIEIRINGETSVAPVTRQSVAKLIVDRGVDAIVETRLDLPVSQGFGMSASGALSAAFALAALLDIPVQKAYEAVHEAEVLHRTGLGDVAALSRGGVTFRRVEGLPPYGSIDRVNTDAPLVIGIVGPPIETHSILRNAALREKINTVGSMCVEVFSKSPTLGNLIALSKEFATRTGLMTEQVAEALEAIRGLGSASMIMLGNSIFAAGELDEIEKVLGEFGKTYRVKIDWIGPRVLSVEK